MKILGLIPARGGSKRLPRKNIRLFNGRPLIAWTILEAKKSSYLDDILVSTDDDEIAQTALDYGIQVVHRPPNLARDDTPMYPVIGHAIKYMKLTDGDAVCLLQPTSPLRRYEDIDACCALMNDFVGAKAVVSVAKGKQAPNGAVYVGFVHWLNKGGNFDSWEPMMYEMPPERSADINTIEEFGAAETQAVMNDAVTKYHGVLSSLAGK